MAPFNNHQHPVRVPARPATTPSWPVAQPTQPSSSVPVRREPARPDPVSTRGQAGDLAQMHRRRDTQVLSSAQVGLGVAAAGRHWIAPVELAAAHEIFYRDVVAKLQQLMGSAEDGQFAGLHYAYTALLQDWLNAKEQLERLRASSTPHASQAGQAGSAMSTWTPPQLGR